MGNKYYDVQKGTKRVWGPNGVYVVRPVSRENDMRRIDWLWAVIVALLAFPVFGAFLVILQAISDLLR